MFIIFHRGQVKETADVSAVISKVSNIHFTSYFSILRCNNAAIAQNICFFISHRGQVKETANVSDTISKISIMYFPLSFSIWCCNNAVIQQNICL